MRKCGGRETEIQRGRWRHGGRQRYRWKHRREKGEDGAQRARWSPRREADIKTGRQRQKGHKGRYKGEMETQGEETETDGGTET